VDITTYGGRNYFVNLGGSMQGQFNLREGVERTPELDAKLKAVVSAFADFYTAMYGPLYGAGINAMYADWTTTSNSDVLIDPSA
jgi:hypothetical protein